MESYQLPHAPAALSMAPLAAARLLALSYWLLALPAGCERLKRAVFWRALLKTKDRRNSQWRAISWLLCWLGLASGAHGARIVGAAKILLFSSRHWAR